MRWLLVAILTLSLSNVGAWAGTTPEPDIWFGPLASDLPALWADGAPWREATRKVTVLALGHAWLRQTPTAELAQLVAYAKRHHIRIDLATEAVEKLPTDHCGGGEGYTFPGELVASARILVGLGVTPEWVDMDEPLWFGSYSTAPVDCQFTLPELVARTAANLRELLKIFPNARLMHIEPIPAITRTATWRQDLTAFHLGLATLLGKPIGVMQVDILWTDLMWQRSLLDLKAYLKQQNIGLGIIYDGLGGSASSTDWINSAIANIETIEGTLHIIPAQATFTSWNLFPTNNLPETDPTTLTWLINYYVRPRTELQARFVGHDAQGKLTTSDGKPIAGATVNGYIPGADFTKPLPVTTVTGVVPTTAVSAILGVRVNTECGGCDGRNNLLIGTMRYQETHSGSVYQTYTIPNNPDVVNGSLLGSAIVGKTSILHIVAQPGQALVMNSKLFPVTANAQFQFTVPEATVGGQGWFGNVIIIWIDGSGHGSRITIVPPAGKALMSTAVTAADGTFSLYRMPRSVDSGNPVTIEFDGGGAYRSTVWTPLQ